MHSLLLLPFAYFLSLANAQSDITISTFTDNECNDISTTSPNVSVPLDACITTIGMGSFHLPSTPCAGGGAAAVLEYGFSDQYCIKSWSLNYVSYGGGCYGAILSGHAFGSILLTCRAESSSGQAPSSDGTSVTITVGLAAAGSSPTGTTSSGTSPGTSSGTSPGTSSVTSTGTGIASAGTDSSDSSTSCNGWSCLSLGEKIGIIVALAVGIPPIIISLYMLRKKQKKNRGGAVA